MPFQERSPIVPLQSVAYAPEDLDEETRAYLADIWQDRGIGKPGVFVNRTRRHELWLLAALGLLAAAICMWLPNRWNPEEQRGAAFACFRVGLLLVGGLLLAAHAHTLWRRFCTGWGSFLFADAAFFWEVSPHLVWVTAIHTVQGALAKHHASDEGKYTHSDVVIVCPEGNKDLTMFARRAASDLVSFLSYCGFLRYEAAGLEFAAVKTSPAQRGTVARRMMDDDSVGMSGIDLSAVPPIPVPHGEPTRGWTARSMLLGATALTCLLVAFTLLPAVATMLADDRQWELAQNESGPTRLRRYLSNPNNTRHRDEAQALINRFYDDAKVRVGKLALGGKEAELSQGLLALLDGLKTAARPVVTVGFQSRIEALPQSPEQKQAAQKSYEVCRRELGERLARLERNASAIVPVGDAFAEQQVRVREDVILARLAAAMTQVLSADVITFERVPAGGVPDIEISYYTFATGELAAVEKKDTIWRGLALDGFPGELMGLLREYEISWKLSIRPSGAGKAFDYTVASRPAASLKYRVSPGDPDWAWYAVQMYSAYHDFSNELIRAFGLEPPPAPNSFSFADASGTREAEGPRLVPVRPR